MLTHGLVRLHAWKGSANCLVEHAREGVGAQALLDAVVSWRSAARESCCVKGSLGWTLAWAEECVEEPSTRGGHGHGMVGG